MIQYFKENTKHTLIKQIRQYHDRLHNKVKCTTHLFNDAYDKY